MIGSVRGTVLERTASGEVLVEVGGVGYRCLVPLGAMAGLMPGGQAFLFTHLHVREDAMTLYGFPTRDERDTFEVLIGASPKKKAPERQAHSARSRIPANSSGVNVSELAFMLLACEAFPTNSAVCSRLRP